MSHSYDLLPSNKKCDTFKVVFDLYTPRAHFIILHRDELHVSHDYNKLNNEGRLKVVKAAMAMVSHYNLQESAILSLHCGSWINTEHTFHAHVCVDVDGYLDIFNNEEKKVPDWPSKDDVTLQWKTSKNPKDYPTNVRGYPFRTFHKNEVTAIKDYRAVVSSIRTKFTILYHPSEPKVGFAVDDFPNSTSPEFRLEAQEALVEFARVNNLTKRSEDENNGCHVCLVLDGKTHGFDLTDSQSLVGYIQVTGPKFYRDICPEDRREQWFDEFEKKNDYKVYT